MLRALGIITTRRHFVADTTPMALQRGPGTVNDQLPFVRHLNALVLTGTRAQMDGQQARFFSGSTGFGSQGHRHLDHDTGGLGEQHLPGIQFMNRDFKAGTAGKGHLAQARPQAAIADVMIGTQRVAELVQPAQ